MYYTNLISNNFSKFKAVKEIVDSNFNLELVKKIFVEGNKIDQRQCFDTFFAACYFGKKEIVNYILQTAKLPGWAFFGGIKIACYGKQLEILHILFHSKKSLTDEECKNSTGLSFTAFLADALVRRFYENSECLPEIFNTAFISSVIYRTVCSFFPINENWIEERYKNDPNWIEIKNSSSKNFGEYKILVCNYRKKTGTKICRQPKTWEHMVCLE